MRFLNKCQLLSVREKSDEASKTVETDMHFLRRRARLFLVGLFGGELKLSLVTMPTRAYTHFVFESVEQYELESDK